MKTETIREKVFHYQLLQEVDKEPQKFCEYCNRIVIRSFSVIDYYI